MTVLVSSFYLHFFYFARRESAKSSEKENLVNPARAKSMMNRPSRMLVLVVEGFLQLLKASYSSQATSHNCWKT
jgi:hypothetical protein